jgi:cyclohexanecarboxylate-CoA ligase
VLTATHRPAAAYRLPEVSIPDRLLRVAADHPDAVGIVDEGRQLRWAEVLDGARRVAGGLRRLGVERGDPVVLQLPNWWETVVGCWAVALAGGVVVPLVPIYRRREVGFVLDQLQPAAVLAAGSWRNRSPAADVAELVAGGTVGGSGRRPPRVVSVRGEVPGTVPFDQLLAGPPVVDAPPADPGDIAVVLTTSGTTAEPKGVLHSHQTLLAEVASVVGWCRLGAEDRVFMASPLSHVTGLCYGVLLPAELGGSVVLQDRWEPQRAVELIEGTRASFTVAATPFLHGLTDAYSRRGQSSLRVFACGGADIPADLVRRACRTLGSQVVRTYGSSELPTSTMADPTGDVFAAADHDGIPMGENEIRLAAPTGPAELEVRGPELFLGYVDESLNAEAFTDDGFFRTGDLATLGAGGELRIVGRLKDIVNRGGEKFSAAEIEAALITHPAVADVAVVGAPDPQLGERVCAWVVPAPAGPPPDLDSLRRHVLASGLAIQKAPERLVVTAELPRTASGKLQRFVLRDELRARRSADGVQEAGPTRR